MILEKVRFAIREAEKAGAICSPYMSDHGVEVRGWQWSLIRRPATRAVVTPVGAVLLAYSPDPDHYEEPEYAAAEALCCSPAFVRGVDDGFAGIVSDVWLGRKEARLHYCAGLRAGTLLLAELTTECPVCGHRRPMVDAACTPCEELKIA